MGAERGKFKTLSHSCIGAASAVIGIIIAKFTSSPLATLVCNNMAVSYTHLLQKYDGTIDQNKSAVIWNASYNNGKTPIHVTSDIKNQK